MLLIASKNSTLIT